MSRHKNRAQSAVDRAYAAGSEPVTLGALPKETRIHVPALNKSISQVMAMGDVEYADYREACKSIQPPNPYHAEEKSFTTRPGGPDTATLMGQYINTYAIGTGASLLMVHPIPANNSFLFIWENP